MERLKFFNADFKIKYRSEEIVLLPKEFHLLQFLYQNPSRIFAREELLDAVWPMDTPTDRTVDDHIYRIRKKLSPLSTVIDIKTVRGQGYQLGLIQEMYKNPLLEDDAVSTNVKGLFRKYHLYGQGDALKLLEENQNVFGFELDLQSRLYLQFMKGEFWWFINEKGISFWDKCFYLLHIFSFIEADKRKCLDYFTRILDAKELPELYRLEIRLLSRLPLLMFTGQMDKAKSLFRKSEKEILKNNVEGFIPNIYISEIYLELLSSDSDKIDEKLLAMGNMLEKYPFSREKAGFLILRGVQCLVNMQLEEAKSYFEKGLELFKAAKFVPGILNSIIIIQYFLIELQMRNDLYDHYQKTWNAYVENYKFVALRQEILSQLEFYL